MIFVLDTQAPTTTITPTTDCDNRPLGRPAQSYAELTCTCVHMCVEGGGGGCRVSTRGHARVCVIIHIII